MSIKVWAHRGASAYAPENTIPAFKKAIEMGAYGVELDVHMSADEKIMVIHDEWVGKTTNGKGKVNELTCQELKKLDASNSMEGFENVRIPTLKEVYGLLKSTDLMVNVEIKCETTIYFGIWDKLIELEKEMGMTGRVIYSSFNHYVLLKIKEADPEAKIALLYDNAMVDPWVYASYLKADAICPHYRAAVNSPGLAKGCKTNGIEVYAWTVNETTMMRELIETGVDGIITNAPDVAKNAIASLDS